MFCSQLVFSSGGVCFLHRYRTQDLQCKVAFLAAEAGLRVARFFPVATALDGDFRSPFSLVNDRLLLGSR